MLLGALLAALAGEWQLAIGSLIVAGVVWFLSHLGTAGLVLLGMIALVIVSVITIWMADSGLQNGKGLLRWLGSFLASL
jgi:hypothetical protein